MGTWLGHMLAPIVPPVRARPWASDATRLPLTFHVKPTRAAHSVISPLKYLGSQSDSQAGISCAIQEGRFGVVSANRWIPRSRVRYP